IIDRIGAKAFGKLSQMRESVEQEATLREKAQQEGKGFFGSSLEATREMLRRNRERFSEGEHIEHPMAHVAPGLFTGGYTFPLPLPRPEEITLPKGAGPIQFQGEALKVIAESTDESGRTLKEIRDILRGDQPGVGAAASLGGGSPYGSGKFG